MLRLGRGAHGCAHFSVAICCVIEDKEKTLCFINLFVSLFPHSFVSSIEEVLRAWLAKSPKQLLADTGYVECAH